MDDKVKELLDRIRDTAAGAARTCPSCGAVCGKEDQFCRRCGAGL